ncbi:MAG: M12 family metallopeptidase [Candidatus Binatia bacterium]
MFPQQLKMCVDKMLPPERLIEAATRAFAENPDNLPGQPAAPRFGVPAMHVQPFRMALIAGKKWQNGRTLRVSFVGGHQTIRQKVMSYAVEWMNHANVRLEFVDDPTAEIRIAFQLGDGSWSYLGTDALTIPTHLPTMNYGWLTSTTADDEYSRVVLHEFGHALGCIHEHQHPQAGIPWDRDAVYRYYWQTQGWSRAEVDNNIFDLVPASQTQFSRFDPTSIMCYAVPNELTVGDYQIGWNRALSPGDREFIGTVYPKTATIDTELIVNAAPLTQSIGRHQEVDTFRFVVKEPATCTLETFGHTDVVMTLAGPNDPARILAEDDDTGEGRNAKIIEKLTPGTYAVKVRHYSPRETGNYQISVRSLSEGNTAREAQRVSRA